MWAASTANGSASEPTPTNPCWARPICSRWPTKSIALVRQMRPVPARPRLAVTLAIAALLPMLPLFLIKYRIGELFKMVLGKLSGY